MPGTTWLKGYWPDSNTQVRGARGGGTGGQGSKQERESPAIIPQGSLLIDHILEEGKAFCESLSIPCAWNRTDRLSYGLSA